MLGVSAARLGQLATALLGGKENAVEKLLERAVESAGERLLDQIVGAAPIANIFQSVDRVAEALQTKGGSEVQRQTNRWISSFRNQAPASVKKVEGLALKLQNMLQRAASKKNPRRRPLWQRNNWATSREQWLADSWMHDWRSQPRRPAGSPEGGEWMEGRLTYPVAPVGHLTTSRRKRHVRRIRAQRRAAVRKTVRQYTSSWNSSAN